MDDLQTITLVALVLGFLPAAIVALIIVKVIVGDVPISVEKGEAGIVG